MTRYPVLDGQLFSFQRDGYTHVVTLPEGLGHITRLYQRNGKLMADTASGIPVIISTPKE